MPITAISFYNFYNITQKQSSVLHENIVDASKDVSNMLIYYLKNAVQKSDLAAELVRDSLILRPDDVQNFLFVKQDIWENAIVEIYDADRNLLGRSYDGEVETSAYFVDDHSDILTKTLRLGKIADFFASPAGLSIRASTPIIAPHDLSCLGAVIVTYPFNTQLLYKIKSSTKHDVFLYANSSGSILSTAGLMSGKTFFQKHERVTLENDKMLIRKDYVGDEVYQSAYRPIRNYEGVTMGYISASINRRNMDHELKYASKRFYIELLIYLSGTIIVIILTTKFMTKPIFQLNEAINRTTKENAFREVYISQNDEIGDLARSFNTMILDLKKKQSELHQAERKYRNIFNNSLEGIVQIATDFRVIDCNISAARIFGYDDVQEFIDANGNVKKSLFFDTDAADSFFGMVSDTGKIKIFEIEMIRRDGTTFPALVSMHFTFDADAGSPVFEGSIADISARKEKEKAEGARDAAEKASEFKSLFLANMSHEIRTPLNAIIGMSGVLQKTELAGKQGEYVKVIDTASRNLLHLVNEILDFSKIESGQMRAEYGFFDLEELVDEILSLFVDQTARKDLEFIAHIDENVPRVVLSDEFRLRQVLINLCSNAFKFTESGEVAISVRMVGTPDPQLLFEITDTGIGIPPDKRGNLFEAFQQVDSSTTRRYGGTGLGLTICRKIVELLGGDIWIDPAYSAGTRFCFTIPSTTSGSRDADDAEYYRLENVRVLLVSGNARLLEVLSRFLDGAGCIVSSVEPCGRALRTDVPEHDVAVVDCARNQMGLGEFLQTCRTPDGAPVRAMVLLPYGEQVDFQIPENFSRVEVMHKPIRRRSFLNCLLGLLGDARSATAETASDAEAHWGPEVRILLVEDNEFNQMVALEVLGGYGPSVTVADNGKVAVDLLAQGHRFDLVLMDVQMPIMDGFEATEIIRRDLGMTRLPIVAMTAHATVEDRVRCLDRGMDDYLSKPIDRRRLQDVLKRYLAS
jgi:PAS domain S-box-containing protein